MPIAERILIALAAGAAAGAALFCPAGCSRQPAPLSFNRSIAPILSENCYQCHGPDPGGRKAGLRLDRAEFAFARHEKSGPAILPGDPDHSPLLARIESRDPKRIMPPPEAHKTLKPEEIALLRRWIKEGAPYEEHWSFIVPKRPPLPAVRDASWVRNPIDQFVLARLEEQGLQPSPEADRPSLIRRVTYDLTGLPPTPAEVDAFVRDASPDAYEKVVDRLLASPRYGEHRAHYWLDAARYGDTHGLHLDDYRSVWPYRDYVISAYNRNMPFDQFVREQIAGDLLPAVRVDQLVATAFIRAGISSGEGGTIPEELRVNNQRERAEAFGAVFLGLTTGCAVCHDHKFDPIAQKDFYRLTAFWNNLEEYPSDENRADWPPSIRVPKPENRPAYDAVLAEEAKIKRRIAQREKQARELISDWIAGGRHPARPISPEGLKLRLLGNEGSGALLHNSADPAHPAPVEVKAGAPIWGEETWFWPTFRMDSTSRVELPDQGNFSGSDAFSVGGWIKPYEGTDHEFETKFGAIASRMGPSQGWELFYDHGKLSFRLVHAWSADLIEVDTAEAVLARGQWNHVLATYDGSGRAAGVRLYIDGRAVPTVVVKDGLKGTILTAAPFELGREYPNQNGLSQTIYQDFRLYARVLPPSDAARMPLEDLAAEIVRKPMSAWSEDEFKAVSDFYFASRDPEVPALAAKLKPLEAALDRLAEGGTPCLVCREAPRLAYADVLIRGVYARRAERVRPGVPHFLPQLPSDRPPDRLALADWLVSPKNPLTARVTVNRMWAQLFGQGIVETTADFGLMGDRPSHPELLDWLAVDFRESGWNVKRFYRQIVMSATYRQSSRITPQLLERDPDNRLLARGPRFRMDAEMIRDTALAASGLLVNRLGGPSVKPYQPDGVWENGTQDYSNTYHYVVDSGNGLYRRSLYTFWKRMVLMPNMAAFDAPARDETCTRRQRSDTPLQALVAMNDPQWLEAARCLGEHAIEAAPTLEGRLDYLGRVLLARPLDRSERLILEEAYRKFQAAYEGEPGPAARLVAIGQSRPDPEISPVRLAPWMLVASTALNLDATLNK